MRVLLIEDEPELAKLLVSSLTAQAYAVDHADRLADAEELLATTSYDLILLDRRLPDGDGLAFLKRLRRSRVTTPVIMATAADAIESRISGLDGGADDYIVKPFALEELLARMRVVLRRPGNALSLELDCANLTFDTTSRSVCIDGRKTVLPRRELAVLEVLMRASGRVVLKEALEEAVYAMDEERLSNALEASISRLRKVLSAAHAKVEIKAVRGVGYHLVARDG